MSIREGGTTKINSLATKIKGLISTHETKTGSSLQKGHVQAGGAPQTIGKTLSAGTDNGYYARADHVHTVDFSNILNTPDALDVIDNTTTDDGTKPLSAKQGKILNDKKVAYMGIDDELNLYIGYDPITDIILTANKSIFQKNESVTFTATAKNGNTLLESVPVLFYNGNNYLGTSVTNSNGIATYNYIGVGAGKINTIAKNCSVVSEPYEVCDATILDVGTSTTYYDGWTDNGISASRDTYTTLHNTTSSSATRYLKINNSTSLSFENFAIEWDNYLTNDVSYVIFRGTSDIVFALQNVILANSKAKLTVIDNVATIYCDGVQVGNTQTINRDSNGKFSFRFQIAGTGTDIGYGNFRVYPI